MAGRAAARENFPVERWRRQLTSPQEKSGIWRRKSEMSCMCGQLVAENIEECGRAGVVAVKTIRNRVCREGLPCRVVEGILPS
jgi:hypothetical protein